MNKRQILKMTIEHIALDIIKPSLKHHGGRVEVLFPPSDFDDLFDIDVNIAVAKGLGAWVHFRLHQDKRLTFSVAGPAPHISTLEELEAFNVITAGVRSLVEEVHRTLREEG